MTDTAARWIRVSSGGQDEANQLPDLDHYIAGHGYSDGPVYTLHDVNASKGEQDTYVDQVIADALPDSHRLQQPAQDSLCKPQAPRREAPARDGGW